MNSRITKRYKLELSKTVEYFVEHIKCGKLLSQKILQLIDFRQGSFYTVLPLDAQIERLYEFSYGGIIPSTSVDLDRRETKILTMDAECSKYVLDFVNIKSNNLAVIENCMEEANSPYAREKNVRLITFESEVYYFIGKRNSLEEVYKTIRKSSQVWHFLAVLTSSENNIEASFKGDWMAEICINTKAVIAGAYDGEGYIFWERSII